MSDAAPVIQAFIVRPDGNIEIQYYEKDEATSRAYHLHSVVADPSVITNLDDIMEDLHDAWLEILVAIRNPPDSFTEHLASSLD